MSKTTKLHYRDTGEGPVILLVHGFTGYSGDWVPFLAKLPNNHRYIIPDLRGHGRSINPADSYTHQQSAYDLYALMDGLNIDRFKAIGLSGGAMALLHMATRQPDRIDSMVLVSATTHYPPQARDMMANIDPDKQSEQAWAAMRSKHPNGDEQIIKIWKNARNFKDDYDDMAFKSSDLNKIRAKTLIVHGDRDALFPADIPVLMYKAIPDSHLWIIPDGNHLPVFGDFMEIFLLITSKFLSN